MNNPRVSIQPMLLLTSVPIDYDWQSGARPIRPRPEHLQPLPQQRCPEPMPRRHRRVAIPRPRSLHQKARPLLGHPAQRESAPTAHRPADPGSPTRRRARQGAPRVFRLPNRQRLCRQRRLVHRNGHRTHKEAAQDQVTCHHAPRP